MNYGAMVAQLKKNEPEGTVATDVMLLKLMQALQVRFKKTPDSTLDELTKALNGHLVYSMKKRYSVERFFSGHGPVASKLRDFDVISRQYAIGSFRLQSELNRFDFKPIVDKQKAKAFQDWLSEVAENTFGQKHMFGVPLPYEPDAIVELETGIHQEKTTGTIGEETVRILVLAVELPNQLKVRFIVRAGDEAMLLYYHPYEEVWLADECTVCLEGVREALEVEWKKLANHCGYTPEHIDLDTHLKEIHEKVNKIFDQEDKLPGSTLFYERAEGHSYIRFVVEDYILMFINTLGQYAGRETILSINMGGSFNSRLEFSHMREFAKQEMVKIVHAGLDSLIKEYLTPVVAAIGVEEVAVVKAPGNYTSVWQAVTRGKK